MLCSRMGCLLTFGRRSSTLMMAFPGVSVSGTRILTARKLLVPSVELLTEVTWAALEPTVTIRSSADATCGKSSALTSMLLKSWLSSVLPESVARDGTTDNILGGLKYLK